MYTTFNTHLGVDKEALSKETIFISDTGIDGNFLLHHFISNSINSNTKVCLFGIAQTLTHYASTAHKLAVNLQKAIDNKQFVFIDTLKLLFNGFVSDENNGNEFATGSTHTEFSLQNLFNLITSNAVEDTPMMVIVDDLSALVNIGVPVQVIADFIHYCKALTYQNMSFVFLTHHEEEHDYLLLHSWLRHYATIEIYVQALKSGYSRELSGEINILRRSSNHSHVMLKRLHFKLLDKDVRFFAPGTSSAVL